MTSKLHGCSISGIGPFNSRIDFVEDPPKSDSWALCDELFSGASIPKTPRARTWTWHQLLQMRLPKRAGAR